MTESSTDQLAFGDAAGEHLRMARGRYEAWVHVVFAFLQVVCMVGFVMLLAAALVLEPPRGRPLIAERALRHQVIFGIGGAGAVGGAGLAWWMFRDRWRCIEAFASRYCTGITMLSLIYVPTVAAVYACVRAKRKLSGRERAIETPKGTT